MCVSEIPVSAVLFVPGHVEFLCQTLDVSQSLAALTCLNKTSKLFYKSV